MWILKRIRNFYSRYHNENTILIYQMGKVGSVTLGKSIPNSIHSHFFYFHPTCPIYRNAIENNLLGKVRTEMYLMLSRWITRQRSRIKVISMVRDVHSRNVSMYFQHLPTWIHSAVTGYPNPKRYRLQYEYRDQDMKFICEIYEKNFNHEYALEWFDKEFKRFTGIDVYKYPFNKEEGYGVIREGRFECLLLTVEQMSKNLAVIENFVGQKINLKSANVGDEKWYAPVYREFKRTYKPSLDYIDKIYASPLMQHFYTKEQIEIFKKRILCDAYNH